MGVLWVPSAQWSDTLYSFTTDTIDVANDPSPYVSLTAADHGLIMTPTLVLEADLDACVEVSTTLADTTATDTDGIVHTYSYADVNTCTTNHYYDNGTLEGATITA